MVACTSTADLMASSEFAHHNIINKAKSHNYYCLQQSNYLTVHTSHSGDRVAWPLVLIFQHVCLGCLFTMKAKCV